MLQAEHLLRDPLHPTAFEVIWSEVPQRLSAIMPSGPLMAYLLVPAAAHGGAEWLAHVVQWGMLALALIASAALAILLVVFFIGRGRPLLQRVRLQVLAGEPIA
jgi:hypothetical protein